MNTSLQLVSEPGRTKAVVAEDPQRASRSALSDSIHSSPRQAAQRQAFVTAFGPAAQLQLDGEAALPLQSKAYPSSQARAVAPVMQRQEPGGRPVRAGRNDTGIPDQLKTNMEAMSGMDLSQVRVHRNSGKPAQLSALAYAQGNEIHLGPGQEQHLPHEAWHVVQQRQGRVQATMQLRGVAVNDDAGLEHEADVMGSRAASMEVGAMSAPLPPTRSEAGPDAALSTQLRAASTAHVPGCCCGNCGAAPLQRKSMSVAVPVVQRTVSVGIQDAQGAVATGVSGHEDSTRLNFSHWPALRAAFDTNVQPHDMPEVDEHGSQTGKTYSRSRYMCAEPNALGLLLKRHRRLGHGLNHLYLQGVSFPALATDSKTAGPIPPCPVCSQWVSSVAPMTVRAVLGTPAMKNDLEFDDEERQVREAHASQEAQALVIKDKQERKEERAVQRSASEQKAATVKALTAKLESSHAKIYATIKLKHVDMLPQIGKKSGQISAEEAKRFSFKVLDAWISGLRATNALIIEKYEDFDTGHQEEFEEWISTHTETINDLIT